DATERGNTPKCFPGTRLARLARLARWPDNPMGGSVQWISGWPGTGKTTVALTMADYWATEGRLAASFFFSKSNEEASTTDRFPATIAYQLESYFRNLGRTFTNSPLLSWPDVVRAIQATLPLSPAPIIVIDGLDECHDIDRQGQLLREILQSVRQLQPSVKFLISCGPERHLRSIFEEYNLPDSSCIRLGQSPEDNDDIRTFLRGSFDQICQKRRKENTMSVMVGQWPSNEDIEKLVDMASGQFIFAADVLNLV
ncbi:hypothetical protein BDN72DRAFT_742045, partial [Pluteus cervinus]